MFEVKILVNKEVVYSNIAYTYNEACVNVDYAFKDILKSAIKDSKVVGMVDNTIYRKKTK